MMLDIMKKGLEAALRIASEAEVYASFSNFASVEIEKDKIHRLEAGSGGGIGIRAVVEGKVGFAYTSDPAKVEDCAREAVKLARVAGSDFRGFSEKQGAYHSVKGIFDPLIADFEVNEKIAYAEMMIDAAKEVDGAIKVTGGEIGTSSGSRWIMNSNGVEISEDSTSIGASVSVALGEISAWDWQESKLLSNIDLESLAKETATLAVNSQKPVKIEGGIKSVILSPRAVSSLFSATAINHLLGDSIQEKRSPYMERVDEAVASDSVTIIDDGRYYNGTGSRIFDGEGTPSCRTVVIEDGILRGFLYDIYTARKEGVDSTGNASRSFDSTPKTAPSNFVIKPGNREEDELIAEVRDGIFVTDLIGAHTASRTSGEFSLLVHNGFRIEKGELGDPLGQVMISGSSPEVLENITLPGSSLRQYGAVISPPLLVEGMRISG